MNPKQRALLTMVLDIVIPTVGYYLLHALGLSDFWALTVAGGVTAIWTLANTVRRGRLDRLGTLVVLEIALSVALFFVTRDPRVVLLKPSFYTALAGGFLLLTCVRGVPLTVQTSRPFALGNDPGSGPAYDAASTDPDFLRVHRQITSVWAVLWLAESVARAIVVLHTGIAVGIWASQIPGIVAILGGILYTRVRVPALRRLVNRCQQPVSQGAGPDSDSATRSIRRHTDRR